MLMVKNIYVEKRVNLASRTKHYRVFVMLHKTGETRLLRKRFGANFPARQYGEKVLARYERLVCLPEPA